MTEELQRIEQPHDQFLAIIAAAMKDPTCEVAKLRELVNLKVQVDIRNAEIAFNEAMSRLSRDLPVISKDGRIKYEGRNGKEGMNTPYATYENIMGCVRPFLVREGFYVAFMQEPAADGIDLICQLGHSLGHKITSRMKLPPETSGSKNAIQARGSSLKFAQRYLLVGILNLVTEGEDDNGKASGYISQAQADALADLMVAAELPTDRREKFLTNFSGADCLEHIQQFDFARAQELLRAVLRKREGR